MKCFDSSTSALFSCANFPHNRNTTFFLPADIFWMTASVKVDQPIFEWLMGSPALTVNDAFNKKTPCSAQWLKLPWLGISMPVSCCNSLKILRREGGGATPAG